MQEKKRLLLQETIKKENILQKEATISILMCRKGENVVVEIPAQAGEKNFQYEQKVKLVNPKLYGRGYAIGEYGYTDFVLVADDILAVIEK